MEAFSGEIYKLECADIYERRIEWKYYSNANKFMTNNNNSFRVVIKWGFNKENIFNGKRRFLDTEIFNNIVHRRNIDTTQVNFNEKAPNLNIWTEEEKKTIVKNFRNKKYLKKIDFSRIHFYYHYLKDYFFGKYKKINKKPNKKIIFKNKTTINN
jgi:hypothetical protein